MFTIGQTYTRKDIYHLLNVPLKRQGGDWHNGYKRYDGDIFIFSNIGTTGRTGHDYENYWDGDRFHWQGKTTSKLSNPTIQEMISGSNGGRIFLFTRNNNKEAFIYEGTVKAQEHFDTTPVKIIWRRD